MADPAVFIAARLPCISCGYDLRSLRLDVRCPECGSPCTDSLASATLYDDAHISKLRTGALLAGFASVQIPCVYLILLCVYGLSESVGVRLYSNSSVYTTLLILGSAGPIVAAIGWFKLLVPAPSVPLPATAALRTTRRVQSTVFAPFAIIYAIIGTLCMIIASMNILNDPRWLVFSLVTLAGLTWAVRMWVSLPILSETCRAAGLRGATSACRIMRWVLIAGAVSLIPGMTFVLLLQDSSDSRSMELAATVLVGLAVAAAAAVSVGNAIYQFRLRRALRNARRLAHARTGPVFELIPTPADPPLASTVP